MPSRDGDGGLLSSEAGPTTGRKEGMVGEGGQGGAEGLISTPLINERRSLTLSDLSSGGIHN